MSKHAQDGIKFSQLRERIEHQKRLFKSAKSRAGERPNRKLSRHELSLLFRPSEQPPNWYHLRQTVIGYAYSPCNTALIDLKPMLLDDLRLETHHRGHLLVVRIFGHPTRWQAVQNAVEDGEGGVERLAVYNFDTTLEISQILPQGGLIAIKEPYYKMTGDGMPTIRVDHPTDLVKLNCHDNEPIPVKLQSTLEESQTQSAFALKERGNTAFKARKYVDAVYHYSRALKICDSNDLLTLADLRRNRAIANLYLKRHENALLDAEAAIVADCEGTDLNLTKVNSKAFYRAGCAAYHLNDFAKAKECFGKTIDINPSDVDALRELRRTNCRLEEQLEGHYDFEAMSKSVTEKCKRLDHASYIANVDIRNTGDRGLGLFAVNAIKAGELVFCEKAFTVAYDNEEEGNTSIVLNLTQDSISMGTHATRLVNIVHKLIHNPNQAKEFFKLYDGGYNPKTLELVQDGLLAIDIFRVQTILEYNGFRCPSTTSLEDDDSKPGGSTGIWLMASYANHDCVGSVSRAFIGDMMIVYANKDIQKGQEITMRYQSPDSSSVAFQDSLQKTWKFRCSCILCQAEAKVSSNQLRLRVCTLKQVDKFLGSPSNQVVNKTPPTSTALRKAEELYEKIESTYNNKLFSCLPRTALTNLSLWLCMAYCLKRPDKILHGSLAVLRDNGIMVTIDKDEVTIIRDNSRLEVSSIHGAMYAAEVLEDRGQKEASRELRTLAMQLYRMAFGSMLRFDEQFVGG